MFVLLFIKIAQLLGFGVFIEAAPAIFEKSDNDFYSRLVRYGPVFDYKN
jgi:hypothetical protein